MIYELPVTNDPAQEFSCSIDGQIFLIRIFLNVRGDYWSLDVNSSEDEPIILGQPLVLGADLLATERFAAGMLFLVDYNSKGQDPSANNLADYGLVWSKDYGR